MHIIINAGGTGTRLWPYSTNDKPKQFVPLVDEENFLRKTYNRLISQFPKEQIWVNTNKKFLELAKSSLPADFPSSHILTEPEKRDNFAAIISHAAIVAHEVGVDTPLLFLHADHLIPKENWRPFNHALTIIADSLTKHQFELITAGVKPQFANTQLGYIQISETDKSGVYNQAVKVQMFKEKPDESTAQQFLNEGNYLWNLGYFSFTFQSLLDNLRRYTPEVISIVNQFYSTGTIDPEMYSLLPKIAFDYAIAEKSDSLGVVGIDIGWQDIGNWDVAAQFLPDSISTPYQIQLAGENNKAKVSNPKRKVAFVGVSNVILVESDEGILVVNPEKAGEVKKVAEYFEKLDNNQG